MMNPLSATLTHMAAFTAAPFITNTTNFSILFAGIVVAFRTLDYYREVFTTVNVGFGNAGRIAGIAGQVW